MCQRPDSGRVIERAFAVRGCERAIDAERECARTVSSFALRDWHATMSALRPSASTRFGFALRLPSACTTPTAPERAASISAVVPR